MSESTTKDLVITVDVEPDVDKNGKILEPLSFRGVEEGGFLLASLLLGIADKITFFLDCNVPFDVIEKLKSWFVEPEFGILFYADDWDPDSKDMKTRLDARNAFQFDREALMEKLSNCIKFYEKLKPKSIRVGNASVNSDLLEWLGKEANSFGLTHSSSTIPGMISKDRTIDHRLYKHDPYRVGNLIEVPFSVYGGDRRSWVSPSMGFGLTDNIFEIMRKVPVLNMNLGLRDFRFGCTPFLMEEEDSIAFNDRLKTWIWFARQQGFLFKTVSQIEAISDEL